MESEFNTGLYNKFNRVRYYHLENIIKKYKHLLKWKSNESILDIGCGTGDITHKFLYPLLPVDFSKFLCTDVSKSMIQTAEKLFKDNPKVFFDTLDIGKDLDDGLKQKFDHIFSIYCLMWIKDQRKVFQNIYDLLLPNGECFIVIVDKHKVVSVVYEVNERPRWKKFMPNLYEVYPHPYHYDPDTVGTVKEMLQSIGFTKMKVALEVSDFAFEDEEEFLGFFKALPNSMALMTEEEQRDYLKEAAEIAVKNDLIIKSGVNDSNEGNGTFLFVYVKK